MFNDARAQAAADVQAALGEPANFTTSDGSTSIDTTVIVHRSRAMVSSNDMQRMNFANVSTNTITVFTADVAAALQKSRNARITLYGTGEVFTTDTVVKRDEFKFVWKVNAATST